MVNDEILSGLRMAVSKGELLHKAMMSFYNSGYNKDEIEEAARIIKNESSSTTPSYAAISPGIDSASQKVSSYGESKKEASKLLLISLVVTALAAVGLIIAFLLLR